MIEKIIDKDGKKVLEVSETKTFTKEQIDGKLIFVKTERAELLDEFNAKDEYLAEEQTKIENQLIKFK